MVYEFRQYKMRSGRRDEFIELFEREFVESQEAFGVRLIGQFRDLDDPDNFVWIRGFPDMEARLAALTAFYQGPVWQAHRQAANAPLLDSDNVLLLRSAGRDFPSPTRPASPTPSDTLIIASILSLPGPVDHDLIEVVAEKVEPALIDVGAVPIATLTTEYAVNSYPRLPVREGEHALVWLGRLPQISVSAADLAEVWDRHVPEPAARLLASPVHLRLRPADRSALR